VLGDEQALSESLRQRFRVSGLYHLLRKYAFPRKKRSHPAARKRRPPDPGSSKR